MNWAAIFMGVQVVTCIGGAIGFVVAKKYDMAWVWLMYGLANLGFVYNAVH